MFILILQYLLLAFIVIFATNNANLNTLKSIYLLLFCFLAVAFGLKAQDQKKIEIEYNRLINNAEPIPGEPNQKQETESKLEPLPPIFP